MSEPLLTVLKFCLLVILYLFFFRVLRAVWVEVKTPVAVSGPSSSRVDKPRRERRPASRRHTPHLVVVEPPEQQGRDFAIGPELTVGRAPGCAIVVDDTYVSQVHARVVERDGQVMVEDLGSTNGSYLNRRRVSGPMVMKRGDRLQVGNTVLELR